MTGADVPAFSLHAARILMRDLRHLRDARANESVMRQKLVAGLTDTFPPATRPWWIERHLRGAEAHLRFATDDGFASGYADSVVGVTAIEYEKDLRRAELYTEGKYQVRQYCAGLLNTGADPAKVRGILSDGVEWHAYELTGLPAKEPGQYSADDVILRELERHECGDDDASAEGLVRFLERYLGRPATRPLTAASIADYFGFGSGTATTQIDTLRQAVEQALADDPPAADLLRTVWTSFMAYLGGSATFDIDAYVRELYLASLAKVMCANVVARMSLHSTDADLDRIMDGRYFADRGLQRLVEHDYFGWMNTRGQTLRSLARTLQADFSAYNFEHAPADDLFGPLLAMLAEREQRILLGQEFTPRWLADEMVAALIESLGEGELPRFVDMCCGSGTMLVATTARARVLLAEAGDRPGTQSYLDALAGAATGFDIDPLAVMLSKVNWVATNRDALGTLDGALSVSVPVYHADSLFALAPVFDDEPTDPSGDYRVRLLGQVVNMPRFLAQPAHQLFFDALLDAAYRLADTVSAAPGHILQTTTAELAVLDAERHPGPVLAEDERGRTTVFLTSFVKALADLIAAGQNGIWVFLVRNSYRPGLVAGQFNGLVTNPPWLAMSKIADNPFTPVLRERAEAYGLRPRGSAFLHLEMATVFLAHAVGHYLAEGGRIACVLPGTVRNGTQHQPFREQLSKPGTRRPPLQMSVTALWSVEPGAFKNRAMVILGRKDTAEALDLIPGRDVSTSTSEATAFHVVSRGNRLIWSTSDAWTGHATPYPSGRFAQGADIMPRQLVFFAVRPAGRKRVSVRPIEPDEPEWFLVSLAKKHQAFRVATRTLTDRFAFPCLLSSHVAPFAIATPSVAMLPVVSEAGRFRLASPSELATAPGVVDHFADVLSESDFNSLDDFWDRGLNCRSKLERQVWASARWLVMYGAGGGIPAAAYRRITGEDNLIVDQTLYWASFDSEDEALYTCGVLNSEALIALISDFIPEGEFGDRHLHTLPLSVLPTYDPADDNHQRVTAATHALTDELAARLDGRLFTTEIEMKKRRQMMRALLHSLDAYAEYAESCDALFSG